MHLGDEFVVTERIFKSISSESVIGSHVRVGGSTVDAAQYRTAEAEEYAQCDHFGKWSDTARRDPWPRQPLSAAG